MKAPNLPCPIGRLVMLFGPANIQAMCSRTQHLAWDTSAGRHDFRFWVSPDLLRLQSSRKSEGQFHGACTVLHGQMQRRDRRNRSFVTAHQGGLCVTPSVTNPSLTDMRHAVVYGLWGVPPHARKPDVNESHLVADPDITFYTRVRHL